MCLAGCCLFWARKDKFTAMCSSILRLFGVEKRKDTLCLADFCLSLAETGNFLQSATLYLHFSAAKSGRKAVQGTTRPLTIPRRGGFHSKERKCPKYGLRTSIIFTSATALLLRCVHVTYGKIARRCSALLDGVGF